MLLGPFLVVGALAFAVAGLWQVRRGHADTDRVGRISLAATVPVGIKLLLAVNSRFLSALQSWFLD